MADLRILRTYRFIDKDPVVDKLRTLVKRRGLLHKKGYAILHELSGGVAASTYANLFDGDTKCPINRTIEATIEALGFERIIVEKDGSFDLDQELKKAAKWALQQNSGKSPRKRRNGHATRR